MQEPCNVEPELHTTIRDAGIWLSCGQCGYRHNLGVFPTLSEVLASQKKHKDGQN